MQQVMQITRQALGRTPSLNDEGGAGPRERILDVALELLAASGVAGVTLRAVGERVGLHNSSLFHHFRGKQEIVAALLARVNDDLRLRLEPLARDEPPSLERFVALLVAASDHYAARPAEARCALRFLLDPPDGAAGDAAAARAGRFTTVLWGWLARAQAAGAIRPVNVSHAARNVLGILLLEPAWSASGTRGARDDERRRAELVAFLRGALAPDGRRAQP